MPTISACEPLFAIVGADAFFAEGRLTLCNKRRFFAAINLEKIEEDGARVFVFGV